MAAEPGPTTPSADSPPAQTWRLSAALIGLLFLAACAYALSLHLGLIAGRQPVRCWVVFCEPGNWQVLTTGPVFCCAGLLMALPRSWAATRLGLALAAVLCLVPTSISSCVAVW